LSLSNKHFEWGLEIQNFKTLTTLFTDLSSNPVIITSQALKFKIDFKFSYIFKFNFDVLIAYFKDEINVLLSFKALNYFYCSFRRSLSIIRQSFLQVMQQNFPIYRLKLSIFGIKLMIAFICFI
jgi:hypothetical protein